MLTNSFIELIIYLLCSKVICVINFPSYLIYRRNHLQLLNLLKFCFKIFGDKSEIRMAKSQKKSDFLKSTFCLLERYVPKSLTLSQPWRFPWSKSWEYSDFSFGWIVLSSKGLPQTPQLYHNESTWYIWLFWCYRHRILILYHIYKAIVAIRDNGAIPTRF